ncbi:MAG: DUF3169 family protein [Oscillospiraceae bacterium]|nr:DUF3169 family protein [Oscillospiraceae bacterium]
MENNDNEIKKDNRKALPMFIGIIVLSAVVGFVLGLASVFIDHSDRIGELGALFGKYMAPCLMIALAIVVPLICVYEYLSAKKILKGWGGEDEEVYEKADSKLSSVIHATSVALIISFFLIAASYSGGMENVSEFTAVAIIGFVAVMAEAIILQQKAVDLIKSTNPEKKGSVYDMRFQKKWLASCDEAEKAMIGQCAYKAYQTTNTVCTVLAVVLALSAMIFGTGFLPSLVVCVIWFANTSAYMREAKKLGKAGVIS